MNFGMKKFSIKTTEKKTLVFEHYNLMDPMELKALIFEVDLHQGKSKILELLCQVLRL
jgi:hypothetical protein